MSTVCRNCRVRVQRLQDGWNNTPPSSGSRRRAPRALRPERGVTQSIPIGRLVETPWSAAARGTARADSRPKSLRSVTWLRANTGISTLIVATGLKLERNIPLHLTFRARGMS